MAASKKKITKTEKDSDLNSTRSGKRIISLRKTAKFLNADLTMQQWKTLIEKHFSKEDPSLKLEGNDAIEKYKKVFSFMKQEMIRMNKCLDVMEAYYSLMASHDAEKATIDAAIKWDVSTDNMEMELLRRQTKEKDQEIRELQMQIENMRNSDNEEHPEPQEVRAD